MVEIAAHSQSQSACCLTMAASFDVLDRVVVPLLFSAKSHIRPSTRFTDFFALMKSHLCQREARPPSLSSLHFFTSD